MKVIAEVPILHHGRQYQPGEEIKDCDETTLGLWLKYKSVSVKSGDDAPVNESKPPSPTGARRPANFQEQLERDNDNVFFNAGSKEFVTVHKIAGVKGEKASQAHECSVIVDYELYKERIVKSDKLENLSLDGLVFFIKKADWIEKIKIMPKVGAVLIFDNKRYSVVSVTDDTGTLEITLSSPRG